MVDSIQARLKTVQAEIKQATILAGRAPESVTLVAVSKMFPTAAILSAFNAGQAIFGENYAQELVQKSDELRSMSPAPEFHFIGKLQRNKVKHVVGRCALIQSVDRIELVQEIAKHGGSAVLLQVNISGEETKSGVRDNEVFTLLEQALSIQSIKVLGLMTIGQFEVMDIELRRREFVRLRELRDSLQQRFGVELPELSMGMSNDFELAIEEGATIVRVGSAIFGQRNYDGE
jgi:pyridoxal phosphate enzyme (YggS family)